MTKPNQNIRSALKKAFTGFKYAPTSAQLELMVQHWELVCSWNKRLNLTSISNSELVANLHYLDSLNVLPFLPPGPVVDLGSGGGFPGIPLAIMEPERQMLLVDSRRKKATFLEYAAIKLSLTKVSGEFISSTNPKHDLFAAAVTRATFSDPNDLLACLSWVKPNGMLLAFRSAPVTIDYPTILHWYEICGEKRLIQIFQQKI